MGVDISIIIPVYNTESQYLRECLHSVINQTFRNIEIICINDGSTNNSLDILREYAQKDKRIVIIDKENAGQGAARNDGLKIATGKYIMFVDSDDWLKNEACELLYNKAENDNVDIVYFNATYYNCKNKERSMFTRVRALFNIYADKKFRVSAKYHLCALQTREPWYKIYKLDFLKQNNIKFSEYRRGEDTTFWLKLLLSRPYASILFKELYNYRINIAGSISATGREHVDILKKVHIECLKTILNSSLNALNKKTFLNSQINWFNYWTTYKYSKKELNRNEKIRKDANRILFDYYDKNELKKIIKSELFWKDYEKYKIRLKKLPKLLFSVTNQFGANKKHKVLTILGLKIKFKCNSYKKIQQNYSELIAKLKTKSKNSKITIGFLVDEKAKWKNEFLYKELQKTEIFEPLVIVTKKYEGYNPQDEQTIDDYIDNIKFFQENGYNVKIGYDYTKKQYVNINDFHCDILFYQHPWDWFPSQSVASSCKNSITCYVPYFIPTSYFPSEYNRPLHRYVFRHYILNKSIKNFYEKQLGHKIPNLRIVGHPVLDSLQEKLTKKRTKNKKITVLYAPHWSIGDRDNNLKWGTFEWSGKFILDYAKQHPELNFIFKPHPVLKRRIEVCEVMTPDEIETYWNEWRKIGRVCEDSNYIDLFSESDFMITDSGSFLTEYALTGNPIIHLCSPTGMKYNYFVQKLCSTYYSAYNKDELLKHLSDLINNNDYKKEIRLNTVKQLNLIGVNASKNIIKDIKQFLEI